MAPIKKPKSQVTMLDSIQLKSFDRERVRLLMKNNNSTLALAFFASLIFHFMFYEHVTPFKLFLIYVPYNFFTLLRFILTKRFHKLDEQKVVLNYKKWEQQFMLLTLCSGLSFAVLNYYFFLEDNATAQLFCIAMSLGYSSGALNTYSSSMKTVVSFTAPTLLGIGFSLVAGGGERVHLILTLMVTLFFLNSLRATKKVYELISNELEFRLKSIQNSKLAALAEMSAGMSHEINNPLMIIQGQALRIQSNLKKDILLKNEELVKSADKMLFHIDRIAGIVSDLRKYSKNLSHQENMVISLDELIEKSISIVRPRAISLGVNIIKALEPKKIHIEGRPFDLSQALVNILNNAIDAADKEPEKWVKIESQEKHNTLSLHIIDSGPGIPENIADQMATPFFTTKDVGKGTGLGLSTSIGIIEAHKGQLKYLAEKSHTTFEISLPTVDYHKKTHLKAS